MNQQILINATAQELRLLVREEIRAALQHPPSAVLDAEATARYLGMTVNTLRHEWQRIGLRRAYATPKLVFLRADLDRWLEEQRHSAA